MEALERSSVPGVATGAGRARRWIALELGNTAIRPEVIEQLVATPHVPAPVVEHAAVFKPFPFRTFLLLDAERLNLPGGAENNRLAEAIRKAIGNNLAGLHKPAALRTEDLPTRTLAMLVETMAYDAAARKLFETPPGVFRGRRCLESRPP